MYRNCGDGARMPHISWYNRPSASVFRSLCLTACLYVIFLLKSQYDTHVDKDSTSGQGAKTCIPVKNVVFLKMHKCASSAVQNIFLRYGHTHNLTFALPSTGNYFDPLDYFRPETALPRPSLYAKEYNIFCHHTRFQQSNIEKLMPNDTVYVTILRNPVALFESAYSYFNLTRRFGVDLPTFVEHPLRYYSYDRKGFWTRFRWNPAMYDLGLDIGHFEDNTAIRQKIQQVDQRFHLVMIAEEMEESLVLLRELLCWEVQDIVTFRRNERPATHVANVSSDLAEKIRRWNSGDTLLYEYFYRVFQNKKVQSGLDRLKQNVAALRKVTEYWTTQCGLLCTQDTSKEIADICENLQRHEMVYTNLLRDRLCPNRVPNV